MASRPLHKQEFSSKRECGQEGTALTTLVHLCPPSLPVCLLCACRSEIIFFYPTGRPGIRLLIREIVALGYSVSSFPLPHTDLSPLPPGVWHCAVVLGDFILFIVAPTESSDSSSDQSAYGSSSHNEPDSNNVDPDFPEDGYWRS